MKKVSAISIKKGVVGILLFVMEITPLVQSNWLIHFVAKHIKLMAYALCVPY